MRLNWEEKSNGHHVAWCGAWKFEVWPVADAHKGMLLELATKKAQEVIDEDR